MTLDELVAEWQISEATLNAAKTRHGEVTKELADYMLAENIKTDLVDVHGKQFKVTVVQTERVKVDEDGLIKAIGKRVFNTVSVRKVDNKLLELALRNGAIDPALVQHSMVVSKSTPYVRVSDYAGDEDER